MKKTTKKNKLTIGLLTASVAMVPMTTLAMNETEGEGKHEVAVLGIEGGKNFVSPEQSFDILVDQKDKGFKSVRQQLEKQSFGVLITSSNGKQIFLDASQNKTSYSNGKVSVKDPSFERYTSYQATILVKSEYQQALKGKFPSTTGYNPISFETGSAVGEATKMSAQLEKDSVAVTEVGKLLVNVTDDYGNATTNATLSLTGEGSGNSRVASAFTAPKEVKITNGVAEIPLADKSAEKVNISYKVVDNANKGAKEVTGNSVMTFTPGVTAKFVDMKMNRTMKAGASQTISAVAVDVYENAVTSGTQVNVNLNQNKTGETGNATVIEDGLFTHELKAPTKAGVYTMLAVSADSQITAEENLTVTSASPDGVQIKLPAELPVGESVPVTGSVQDEYDNPVVNETVTIGGGLTGKLTTDEEGNFSGNVQVVGSGTVSSNVGGVNVPLKNADGTEIKTITATESAIDPANMRKTTEGIEYTTDGGKTWKKVYISSRFQGFVYDSVNKVYVGIANSYVYGNNGQYLYGYIYTSKDGIKWTSKKNLAFPLYGVATDDKGAVVVGGGISSSYGNTTKIYTTLNGGASWSETLSVYKSSSSTGYSFGGIVQSISYANGIFTAKALNKNSYYYQTSPNGVNWTWKK